MLMSNTIRARANIRFRRCDRCGAQGERLTVESDAAGRTLLRCVYQCRREQRPSPVDRAAVLRLHDSDGWYDRKKGYWKNTAPEYCRWCGGRFYQWIRTWRDSMELDSPHCGNCTVPWEGDDFAYGDKEHVHRHEYHYSTDWARDSEDYFEDGINPLAALLQENRMQAEGMYCMEMGFCDRRFLSVPEFVRLYGVMGRSWIFERQFKDLDWSATDPYDDMHRWDFTAQPAVAMRA